MWKLVVLLLCCGVAQAQTELGAQSCSQEASLISLNGDTPTSIQFINNTSGGVRIYWINYQAVRTFYTALPPGQSYVQPTFVTHPWVVTDNSDKCLAIFQPVAGLGIARVGGAGSGDGTAAALQASSSALPFRASAGGDFPPAQALTITPATGSTARFSIQIDAGTAGSPAPTFLSVSPLNGTAPDVITVRASTGALAAGTYTARLRISSPAAPAQAPLDIPVTLAVSAAAPKLEASPTLERIEVLSSTASAQDSLVVLRNQGGGGPLDFTASISGRSPWLAISPSAGRINPNAPASVHLSVDARGLAPGNYLDSVQIATPAGSSAVPVSLFVAPGGPALDLDLTGVRFRGRQGQGIPNVFSVQILDRGETGTIVNWNAEILSGGDWLTLSPAAGMSTPARPSLLTLRTTAAVNTFPAGARYALVRVSAAGALTSPQFIAAVLDIAPANAPVFPDPDPAGLFFSAAAGASPPPPQTFLVNGSSVSPVAFQATATTSDGVAWLASASSSNTTSTANPATVTVTANPSLLTPGIYTGSIQLVIGTALRSVNVTLAVRPAASASPAGGRSAAACVPSRLAATHTELANNFSLPASYPIALIVQLNNDCGDPVLNGSVVASFSNGDPPLVLRGDTSGVYTATWQPRNANAQTTVTARATAGALQSVTATLTGGVTDNPNPAPALVTAGVLNNLNPIVGAALAPGAVAQIYGSGLASAVASPTSLPLPGVLNGTEILIGGLDAPIYYLSPGQMSVQIPNELAPGRSYTIIAQVNGALSLPDTINLAPAMPGIAAFADGTLMRSAPISAWWTPRTRRIPMSLW